jgi:hypothetical protein
MTMTRTPTNRELLAAKQAQAPIAPSVPAVMPKPATAAMTSAERNKEYRSRYLDEVAPSGIAGRLIKFGKDGAYVTSDDGAALPEAAEYILLADDTLVGWMKFNGVGEAPEKIMGLLFEGFEMPSRESLGDLDPKAWELGLDNQPQDPWLHQQCLVLQNTETAELYTFTTSSKTGRRAVGQLLRHYERMQRTKPDELPVIRLGKGGFKHKDSRVGWVDTPVFVVVGRAPRDSAAKPDTSLGTFLDDKIVF